MCRHQPIKIGAWQYHQRRRLDGPDLGRARRPIEQAHFSEEGAAGKFGQWLVANTFGKNGNPPEHNNVKRLPFFSGIEYHLAGQKLALMGKSLDNAQLTLTKIAE